MLILVTLENEQDKVYIYQYIYLEARIHHQITLYHSDIQIITIEEMCLLYLIFPIIP